MSVPGYLRLIVAVFMALVVGGGPALAICDHGPHHADIHTGAALDNEDHCPICDRAMPLAVVPVTAIAPEADAIPVALENAPLVASAWTPVPVEAGRGPPQRG